MKVVLDAGHGYHTPGKRSPDGLKEYEINRAIAAYTKAAILTYQNVNVIYTHNDKHDVPLKTRTDQANLIQATCFISIHANASGDGNTWNDANGIETFIHNHASKRSLSLAEKIQTNLIIATGLKDRGVRTSNFHVLRETKMAAVLIECGFMTNSDEIKLLRSETYRKACGEAIAKAIAEEYELKKFPEPPTINEPLKGIYKVQIGAYKNKQHAEILANKLRKQGYDPFIIYQNQK
ncbi:MULTISPECIES: N-acetylmuramoyl-L-alanine amidase [Bacillus]|uniref:N-acetylmuramoyl-L-alanine amidase n=1 Tax=Bacillus TaxID=1386 RepID=UPI0002F0EE69|nr:MULTISPECIES: N-acetylmuramoyl-L-alanine amidase [Bacillus]